MTKTINVRSNRNDLPESVVLDRKGRKVGSDDMGSAALIAKYAEHAGIRGNNLDVAAGLALAIEAAVSLSLNGKHREAAKKAASCNYVLKRNEHVGKLKVNCRDGRERKLSDVVGWFAGVHFRIADDIDAAVAKEAAAAEAAKVAAAALAETRSRNAALKEKVAKIVKAA